MKWWAGSFFWRTLAVLVIALVASQAASFWLFRQQVQQPRMGMAIGSFVSHLRTIHAALSTLPPGAEREFLERLAEKEGIRVFPARGEMPGRLAGDRPGMHMFRERIKALFGEDTEVFVRPGTPGEFWVRLRAADREFWVAFPRNRVDRDNTDALLYWMLAGVAIAIAATGLIAWRLNRPLARLARAAEALGKGGDPEPVPESGPSEVRAVAAAFNRMKESLKHDERERTTFLAGISHDLRTPLARLRLDAEMLEGRVDAATQKGMIADIEDMNAIIDQFIDFARSEATEAYSPVDLGAVARGCAERAARAGARVGCELAELPPLMLRPLAIQRLVDNLIQNAAKHGGGEILVRTARRGDEAVVSVLDRGPGIPAADIERLKEPFTRRDEARSGRSGAGLGLAIVARIAKAHGARFDLAPRDGGGLEASVAFPVAA
ncbi:MAG: HAMP domain-containing protein [Betaproteobacteria bacterium]|nr:HAMP domain-containing protein [Betaproteobacteria bacterium]PWB58035.1 MAG: two-component sensor histidine kinase [Betaproteobacteria bacterium]